MTRYYEDFAVGETFETGDYEVTKAEMLEFAEKYDPQPFHLDEEAAQESLFGGLAASGWHTAAMCMRLLVDDYLDPGSSLGARGVDELRWHRPVHPGDTLTVEIEVLEKRPSESRPDIGHVRTRLTGYTDGEAAISWEALGMVRRRDTDENAGE